MIANLKNLILVTFLTSGFYIFLSELNNLNKINYKLIQNKIISEPTENYIDKEYDFKKENLTKKENDTTNNIEHDDLTKIEIIVSRGDTFMSILKKFNISESIIFNIINEIENYYDLKKLKINNKIIFYKNLNEIIKKLE